MLVAIVAALSAGVLELRTLSVSSTLAAPGAGTATTAMRTTAD